MKASEQDQTPLPPTAVYGMGRTDAPGSARDLYCWSSTTRAAVSDAKIDAGLRKELAASLDDLIRELDPLSVANDDAAAARARSLVEAVQKRFAAIDVESRSVISQCIKRVFVYEFLLLNGNDLVSEGPEHFELTPEQLASLKVLADLRREQFKSLAKKTPALMMACLHDHRVAIRNELTPAQLKKLDAYLDEELKRAQNAK